MRTLQKSLDSKLFVEQLCPDIGGPGHVKYPVFAQGPNACCYGSHDNCRTAPSFLHSNLTVSTTCTTCTVLWLRQEQASGSLQLIKRFRPDLQASSSEVVFICCRLLGHSSWSDATILRSVGMLALLCNSVQVCCYHIACLRRALAGRAPAQFQHRLLQGFK